MSTSPSGAIGAKSDVTAESKPPRAFDPFGTLTLRVATLSEAFLADDGERNRLGMPVGNDKAMPVVVEMNLSHVDGLTAAIARFRDIFKDLFPTRKEPLLLADTYCRCSLSVNEVRQLIRKDQMTGKLKQRSIFRVWPDFRMKALIDRSVSTVKADAARRSYDASDAIDWSWREGAAVLSNSWGGGAPSDAISRAFARARTQGRKGLGSVVVIAAGNSQSPIDFPGDLPGYVTVGASNPADERKTRTSSDNETWWGSNFGATMNLLAPGVFIWTTDIVGAAGYEPGDFTKTFNGTSSATPAVAGTAALMLSANPALSASSVRDLLGKTAKKLKGQTTWTPELGWGRLDAAKAVGAAQVAGTTTAPRKAKKVAATKRRRPT